MSLSKLAFTLAFQWWEIGIGVCLDTGMAFSLKWIFAAGPDNAANGAELLNTLTENLFLMYCSNFGMFSVVVGYGSLAGLAGGAGRGGVVVEAGGRLSWFREWVWEFGDA